jgi:pyruvate-formate lyase
MNNDTGRIDTLPTYGTGPQDAPHGTGPTLEANEQRANYEQEMLEANAFLQKQVSERAAKYKPRNPLDELRRLREQARLAMPEIMEFVDQALEHSEQLSDENERLERELEETRQERNAAVADISHGCYTCAHKPAQARQKCVKGCYLTGLTIYNPELCEWEWRGPKEGDKR